MARGRQGLEDPTEVPGEAREQTRRRSPLGRGRLRPWSETVRRASLAVEGLLSGR
jgi:hypothetical protein